MALDGTREGRGIAGLLDPDGLEERLARVRAAHEGRAPLIGLDEHLIPTGAHWTAEAPAGEGWGIRWNEATGTVQSRPLAHSSPGGFSGEAADLPAARRVALYIAELIADGKTEETKP